MLTMFKTSLDYFKDHNSKMGMCTRKYQICFKFLDKRNFTLPNNHSK